MGVPAPYSLLTPEEEIELSTGTEASNFIMN